MSQAEEAQAFWQNRLNQFGHTGWADPIIYAYDQLERVELIKERLAVHLGRGGIALDFGCGTGDFSKLLLQLGFSVLGYDPYVRPSINSKRFTYANSYADLPKELRYIHIILSVTVLDHVRNDGALSSALGVCQRVLKADGRFFLLEYALDADGQRLGLENSYQAFRTLAQWQAVLNQHGFEILRVSPVAHPEFCPSIGYQEYASSALVVWARRFPFAVSWLKALLKWHAAKFVNRHNLYPKGPSPLKLIECGVRR